MIGSLRVMRTEFNLMRARAEKAEACLKDWLELRQDLDERLAEADANEKFLLSEIEHLRADPKVVAQTKGDVGGQIEHESVAACPPAQDDDLPRDTDSNLGAVWAPLRQRLINMMVQHVHVAGEAVPELEELRSLLESKSQTLPTELGGWLRCRSHREAEHILAEVRRPQCANRCGRSIDDFDREHRAGFCELCYALEAEHIGARTCI